MTANTTNAPQDQTATRITGVDIPFNDLVILLIKVGVAAIPAAIIVTAAVLTVWVVLTAVLLSAG